MSDVHIDVQEQEHTTVEIIVDENSAQSAADALAAAEAVLAAMQALLDQWNPGQGIVVTDPTTGEQATVNEALQNVYEEIENGGVGIVTPQENGLMTSGMLSALFPPRIETVGTIILTPTGISVSEFEIAFSTQVIPQIEDPIELPIAPSAAGKGRYVGLDMDATGSLETVSGPESVSNFVPPNQTPGKIRIKDILVYEGTIEQPVVTTGFVEKESAQYTLIYSSGIVNNLPRSIRGGYILRGTVTAVCGLSSQELPPEQTPFPGQFMFIENRQAIAAFLRHNHVAGNYKLWFPDSQDYYLGVNHVALFYWDKQNVRYTFLCGSLSKNRQSIVFPLSANLPASPLWSGVNRESNVFAPSSYLTGYYDGIANTISEARVGKLPIPFRSILKSATFVSSTIGAETEFRLVYFEVVSNLAVNVHIMANVVIPVTSQARNYVFATDSAFQMNAGGFLTWFAFNNNVLSGTLRSSMINAVIEEV